eukprot:jgi/Botrbrau1/16418/Bobra.0142s0017.1
MSPSANWAVYLAVIAAIWAVITGSCLGGDYRGRTHEEVPQELWYFNHKPTKVLKRHHLPRQFDWCNLGGEDWCTTSWNQHVPIYCGSCWAHGALSMINDRLKIRKNAKGPDVMLSRQTLLNCGHYEHMGHGCDGGDVIDVFRYMAKFGLPDESCMTYNATDHTKYPRDLEHCPAGAICRNCMPVNGTDTCWAVETPILYKLKRYGKVEGHHHERAMMSEIFKRGPIVCSMAVPYILEYDYRGGVYIDHSNSTIKEIDHDVEVVGWGEEDGVKFWRVRNSWGTFWGELGFFRIERGVNALFLENGDCWYAEPEFDMESKVRKHKLVGSMYGVIKAGSGHDVESLGPPELPLKGEPAGISASSQRSRPVEVIR